jgi:excisionase family DNA binding protein
MYYKVKDVSKLLGVSVPTIINWCNQDKLKCMRTLTNHRLFDKDYINGLVEDMRHGI